MDIYNVNLGDARLPDQTRISRFFALYAITAPIYFCVEWLWPWHHGKKDIWEILFLALVWGFIMSVIYSSKKMMLSISQSWSEYQLVVDDDEISARNFKSSNWLLSRTIGRGQIRTVIEKEKGLLISRHTRFGTHLWGGIWIPRQLADYEYLKRLTAEWKVERE